MFRRLEKAARIVVKACQQGGGALELRILRANGTTDAINARTCFPCQCGHPSQDRFWPSDRFQPDQRSTLNIPGYGGQLEPLSYARLFAAVMIHAHSIAEIAFCKRSDMSGFYTHVSLEFFEQTAKLLQKMKTLKLDEKDRATLKENLSTIHALTELNFRLRGLYCRESVRNRSYLPDVQKLGYEKRKEAYEKLKLDKFDQLDSVQKDGHGISLSHGAEAERSSILHDQRWAHLKSYAAHWLEKITEGPNKLFPAELAKCDMERMCQKPISIERG